jgi:cytochrome c553
MGSLAMPFPLYLRLRTELAQFTRGFGLARGRRTSSRKQRMVLKLPRRCSGFQRTADVERGDPARGLPACNACHGFNSGSPIETPSLSRQNKEYLASQLHAFKSSDRRNDIYTRMRGIAFGDRPCPSRVRSLR